MTNLLRLRAALVSALLVLPLLLAARPAAYADDYFAPPKITEWNGTTWGKLTDQTTQEGIKKDYKNGRGDFRNSVELKTRENLPYKIIALFPNVQKNAPLDGIVIKWRDEKNDGLALSGLQTALGDASSGMVTRHPLVRHENWEIALWPKSGVAALVMDGRAAWVLLGKPGRVASLVSRFGDHPADLSPVPDPGLGKSKEIVYGHVQASFDLKNISLDRKDRERDDTESDLRRAGDGRSRDPLRYERDVEGTYSVSIYAHPSDSKDTDGRVTARIEGTTPYGRIDVSADETFTIEKGKRHLEDTPFYRAIVKAERSVEEKAGRALRAQGPPTREAVRQSQWTRIVEDYRNASATVSPASGGSGGGLL